MPCRHGGAALRLYGEQNLALCGVDHGAQVHIPLVKGVKPGAQRVAPAALLVEVGKHAFGAACRDRRLIAEEVGRRGRKTLTLCADEQATHAGLPEVVHLQLVLFAAVFCRNLIGQAARRGFPRREVGGAAFHRPAAAHGEVGEGGRAVKTVLVDNDLFCRCRKAQQKRERRRAQKFCKQFHVDFLRVFSYFNCSIRRAASKYKKSTVSGGAFAECEERVQVWCTKGNKAKNIRYPVGGGGGGGRPARQGGGGGGGGGRQAMRINYDCFVWGGGELRWGWCGGIRAGRGCGSGGVGGVFAPSLFTGGVTGFLIAYLINMTGVITVPVSYFVLAGMAGVMSGVMNSPLTAMFLIAEITSGYSLLVPLMITSVTAHLTGRGMEPYSIYARRLAMKGDLITHNKDKAVLTLMKLNKVIETDLQTISIEATLGDLVKKVSRSSRNIFPVIDENEALLGIVLLDDIRKIMFNQDLYNVTFVRDFMTTPPTIVDVTDSMDLVMKKFEDTGAWNLPVIEEGRYIGFVSKAKIFNTYRRVLQHFSDE